MNMLTADALQAIEHLTDLEQKYCLNMVSRLKNLGLHQHTDTAVCALAEAGAMPIKH